MKLRIGRYEVEVGLRPGDFSLRPTSDGTVRQVPAYVAKVIGRTGVWGRGLSASAAIGDMILAHSQLFTCGGV